MKKSIFLTLFLLISTIVVVAEPIKTAMDVFNKAGEKFGTIEDYQANFSIKVEDEEEDDMAGVLYYKNPDKIRLSFSEPKNQVIVSDGKTLTVYRPDTSVVMTQKLEKDGEVIPPMMDPSGFSLYRVNYNIAYNGSSDFITLEDRDIKVRQLKLTWKRTSVGYKKIIMSFDKDYNLVQIDSITSSDKRFIYNFSNIKYNVGMADARFTDYKVPSSAYEVENFLFDPKE